MVDVEKALLDPGLVFKTPQELLANDELSREQKIEILRRWEYDVRAVASRRRGEYGGAAAGNIRGCAARAARHRRSRRSRAIRAYKTRGKLVSTR